MKASLQTARTTQTTWLKTSDPVVPVNNSGTKDSLSAVHAALCQGVEGIPDLKRSGFFEIEVGDRWYYIHIPMVMMRVYLVASGVKPFHRF